MRKMTNGSGATLKVVMHLITINHWEYYLEQPDKDGIAFGYVESEFSEMGYVDVNELRPFLLSAIKGPRLYEIMPASGWEWEDENAEALL